MLSIERIASKYRGKMVRFVTRNETCIQGFYLGFREGYLMVFVPTADRNLMLQRVSMSSVRAVLPSGLVEDQGRLCRYLYGNIN